MLYRNVSYLDIRDLRGHGDAYAGAWWMSVERFATFPTDHITNNEAAMFRAMEPNTDIRMTRDWMEFAVEHLSKYWKTVNYINHGAGHRRLIHDLFLHVLQATQSDARLSTQFRAFQ